MWRLLLLFAFGSPRTAFALHVLAALTRLCPCTPADGLCLALHRESAVGIAIVSGEQRDPEHVAALLVGVGAHETCFRVERQTHGGPAVGVYQIEVPPAQRPAILADPVLSARLALRAARTCGGSMIGYAWGACHGADAAHLRAAAELRASVLTAWWALAQ